MSWGTVKFGDLYLIPSRNGLMRPSRVRGEGFKMVNMGELFANQMIGDIPMERVPMNERELENSSLAQGDLLFARQSLVLEGAGQCSYVAAVAEPTTFESHLIRVRLDQSKADPLFYHYFFRSPYSGMSTIVQQCAQAGIRASELSELPVGYPPIQEQRKIVGQLLPYDDLIENNRRRMALLEDSARQLYREWFVRLRFPGHEHTPIVDGVLQGWVKLPATEALEINPKIKLSDAEEHWFVEMANLPTDSMVIEGAYLREGRSGPKFQNGDTLFARITPCLENGKTGFVDFMDEGEVGRGSTEFIVLRSKRVTPEFVYCLSRTYEFRGNAIKSMIGSSGRQRVQESCFEKFMVNVPPTSLLRLFSDFAEPAFEEIKNLASQNQKLRQARDLLLPRLMSGELAV
jgi:type I restriction enzyme S subunit